jgi:hypothetical protein
MNTAMIAIIKSTTIKASTMINSLVPDSISQHADKRKGHPQSGPSHQLKSGREDLNLRPLGPKPSALARLCYAPIFMFSIVEAEAFRVGHSSGQFL